MNPTASLWIVETAGLFTRLLLTGPFSGSQEVQDRWRVCYCFIPAAAGFVTKGRNEFN